VRETYFQLDENEVWNVFGPDFEDNLNNKICSNLNANFCQSMTDFWTTWDPEPEST
jgi:hypothetical protein